MAYTRSIRLAVEPARSLGFALIGAGYTGVGGVMENPVRILLITNLTNASLWFSHDGVEDHLPLPANSSFTLDITANKSSDAGYYLPEGTRISVKQLGIPTQGSVYVTVYYGETE